MFLKREEYFPKLTPAQDYELTLGLRKWLNGEWNLEIVKVAFIKTPEIFEEMIDTYGPQICTRFQNAQNAHHIPVDYEYGT